MHRAYVLPGKSPQAHEIHRPVPNKRATTASYIPSTAKSLIGPSTGNVA